MKTGRRRIPRRPVVFESNPVHQIGIGRHRPIGGIYDLLHSVGDVAQGLHIHADRVAQHPVALLADLGRESMQIIPQLLDAGKEVRDRFRQPLGITVKRSVIETYRPQVSKLRGAFPRAACSPAVGRSR